MTERYDILEALAAINPRTLSYEEWLAVGQALHHEGYASDMWRDWSRADAERFDERDFEVKWRSFGHETGAPITGGTIIKMAKEAGWNPKSALPSYDWDSTIGESAPLVDAAYVTGETVAPLYSDGQGRNELAAYIDALFEPDEYVAYVTSYSKKERDGVVKLVPGDRGVYARTAQNIRDALKSGMENALGTLYDESGAWIRFNPLDGHGVGNANVTAFRHCLVESDETEPATVKAVVEQLNLPVSAMVYSGGKSMHVIVKVDAKDSDEYRKRVEKVYSVCEKSGVSVDKANKNPSRLSRMPGVTRRGKRQFLAALKCGADDYEEWEEWYAEQADELPDTENVSALLEDGRPEMADELIGGVLRCGHKMLVSGPSKAGKSFALIALCVALSQGMKWIGLECRKSRVLYVNLELDRDSCTNRFADVCKAMGVKPEDLDGLDVWNLRGRAEPMPQLKPKLIRRGKKGGYDAVVIDPIYKVMTGDENSATDMTRFANAFDEIAMEVGCAVIYCHHHSKGYQQGKRSIDRASGSGVFARDPDAIMDMVELAPKEDLAQMHEGETAWKIEATLREFPALAPIGVWFKWPIHIIDSKLGNSEELGEKRERDRLRGGSDGKGRSKKSYREKVNEAIGEAVSSCQDDGVKPTLTNVLERMPAINGKKPKRKNLAYWTRKTQCEWCDWKTKMEVLDGKTPAVIERVGEFDEYDVW